MNAATTATLDTLTVNLPETIDISTGLPAIVCGVDCFVEAFHVDADGNYSESPTARVRVSITTVVGDRVAQIDVDTEDAGRCSLSRVLTFAVDQLDGPCSWPRWSDAVPVRIFAL
jgi:hypothetical protein